MSYTILSIGPIYETMKNADNTRAVWTVSFMFSYLMRETIRALREEHSIADESFVVPTINDSFKKYLQNGNRAGLFHDRLILKGDHAENINEAYKTAVINLTDIIVETFNTSKNKKFVKIDFDEQEVRDHFNTYFQSYIASVDLKEGENPVLALSAYVDAVEYEPRLAKYEEKEYLHAFLRLTNLGALQEISFLNDSKMVSKERCFKSLPEISAWELIEDQEEEWKKKHLCLKLSEATALEKEIKSPEKETDEIIKMLEKQFRSSKDKEANKTFKPYHKYVAVVQADGDGFGKYLANIGDDSTKLQAFSTDIFQFASEAVKIIESYGGSVVMAGGDDLLFLSPVVGDNMNIFTLISEIDIAFVNIFGDNESLSMSYGISVSYYKFPLQEAFEMAYNSLIYQAKETKWININDHDSMKFNLSEKDLKNLPAKNAIHLNIRKHSGQSHSLTLPKDSKLFKLFLELLENELDKDANLHLPHALHHALEQSASIIDVISSQRLNHFFKNQFDEDIHKTKHKEALEAVINILITLKDDSDNQHLLLKLDNQKDTYRVKYPSEVIFSILSTIKLLRGDS